MGLNETTVPHGHEHRDINFSAVVMFAVALAAALVVIHFAVVSVFRHLASQPTAYPFPRPLANATPAFNGPGLAVNQSEDMDKLRAAEEATLSSYGWVDRDHGVVRMPIDRAIDVLVETNRGALK